MMDERHDPPVPSGAEAPLDVLCVGHASYDLVFSVSHHPDPDEKIFADGFTGCGGGPAANAAVTVARLGLRAAFGGYLGQDLYGEKHWHELASEGICTRFIARGPSPTPVSIVLVKPDGRRALVNYKGETQYTAADRIDFSTATPKVMLFDGHEPLLSAPLALRARQEGIPTVLDAGSLHPGIRTLMDQVDYLACSEKFACQYLGRQDEEEALSRLAEHAAVVVITLGERGLVWQRAGERGALPAFPVTAVDTTGAGDAFHGAFAAAVAAGMAWSDVLRYASAAGALCCTKMGARAGLPFLREIQALLARHPEQAGV
jgi:sulfofructose kinase